MKYTNNNYPFMNNDYLSCPNSIDKRTTVNPYMNGMNMANMKCKQGLMDMPMLPLYDYDDCEENDRDLEYMKYMYPKIAKKIQKEIDEECDKLEYDGSCMFDEYPDRTRLGMIVNDIYKRIKDLDERLDEVESEDVEISQRPYDFRDGRYPRRPTLRPPYGGRQENYLRDFIEILLFNEIYNRRRRRRSRRRRFY